MKMLKIHLAPFFTLILFTASSFCNGQDLKNADKALQDTSINYKDGTYEGKSRAYYTGEPFWGSVQITLLNGSFSDIRFTIRDSSLHETFNGDYEKHFQGNPLYIQQCRNDWNGVQTYPKKLSEIQNLDKIDAMSGATWSYNIFKASAKEALKSADK
jgi:major membrane immunogen (membrane-anchored lipoprotein)